MKERDRPLVRTLRTTLAAIDNAGAVGAEHAPAGPQGDHHVAGSVPGLHAAEVTRRELDETEQVAIVRAEAEDLDNAATELERAGQPERAEELRHEAAALLRVLDGGSR